MIAGGCATAGDSADKATVTVEEMERAESAKDSSRRVILLGCVKKKAGQARSAKDLYVSPLWRARRRYAESQAAPWYILSALHGLVDPGQILEPYDLALKDRPASERRAWGAEVAADLERAVGPLKSVVVEVHAGAAYRTAIEPYLRNRGAIIASPTEKISGVGAQIAWYHNHR